MAPFRAGSWKSYFFFLFFFHSSICYQRFHISAQEYKPSLGAYRRNRDPCGATWRLFVAPLSANRQINDGRVASLGECRGCEVVAVATDQCSHWVNFNESKRHKAPCGQFRVDEWVKVGRVRFSRWRLWGPLRGKCIRVRPERIWPRSLEFSLCSWQLDRLVI